MQQRKRLTRANRKPLDSFDQTPHDDSGPCNLLKSIQNNNLYLKLVGIALEMSREAGVSQLSLQEVQKKLLAFKGFQEYSMLNQNRKNQLLSQDTLNKKLPYNPSKKYITPQQQLSFLNRMEKQVREVQTKEHIVYALKKYIEQKKKTLYDHSTKVQNNTRARAFLQKIKVRSSKKNIQRSNYYGQTLRQIFGRIAPRKSFAYQIIRKMTHLKSIWGHTFFSQTQQQYCPVYNVIFDKSQKMILSGGEDGKIKVWSRDTGALISTLQGHKDYINKICVTKDNKIILSAANDGVRFFDLSNLLSLTGFHIDNIMDIGQVQHKNDQGSSILFANGQRLYVIPKQRIWSQRNRKLQCYDFKIYNFGSRLKQNTFNTNTITVTPKGFIFLGFIQGQIIIFDFNKLNEAEIDPQNFGTAEGMDPIPEYVLPIHCILDAHEGDIIEITWNPILSVFSTGAKKDGVCKIWQYNLEQPTKRPLMIKQIKIPKHKTKRKRRIYNCNFCCWNSTFTHVTCSFEQQQIQQELEYRGDGQVVVYNAMKQQITWQISKSLELSSIRALDSHPFLPNIMLICDSFGKVIIVDIFENFIVNLFEQRAFHLGHPAFCLVPSQCRFSQDGMNFVVATQYGNCSIYGYDIKQFYHLYPTEQLLTNDYKQIIIDPITFKPFLQDGTVLDANQQQNQELQNMRHAPYKNYKRINPILFQKQIQDPIPKGRHQNHFELPLQEIQRMGECYLQYERNQQFLRHNLQQIQNKRMSLLYDERMARQDKIKSIINQKLKQFDGYSASLQNTNQLSFHNLSIHGSSSNQPNISQISQPITRQGRGRRSTRNQSTNNVRINNYNTQMDSDNDLNDQNQNKEQGQESCYQSVWESQNQSEKVSLVQSDYSDQSNSYQDNLHRRRNTNRINRAAQNNRIRRNTRRPASQQVQQLQKAYDQQYGGRPKKRTFQIKQDEQENNQDHQQEKKKQIRRVASRSLAQMRNQRTNCTLCLFKEAVVSCFECQHKKFCEGCRNSRGKKISENNRYMCFQCYYQKNLSAQVHKNLSFQKYIMTQRNDLFVPQIGDQVVYFFQGYEQFLYDKIQTLNNKYLDLGIIFNVVPHQSHPQLINIQKCVVTDISYAFPLQQQNQLSYKNNLNRVRGRQNKTNNQQDILTLITLKADNGTEFRVFHFPGYQFLLKWQIYQDIIQNQRYGKFKLFDIVKIKQEQIQIMEVRPLNSNYNNSIWKNIIVHKAQNKYLRRHRDKNDDIAVNIWNIDGFIDTRSLEYTKCMSVKSREHYKNQIQKIRTNQSKMWEIFSQFVDTEVYPLYNQYVQVSMCLTLILQRLQNNYYASQQSFIKDVKMLTQNSISFNTKQSQVTQLSEKMVKMILEGQNYNHDNQVDPSTQKKGRIKRKPHSGSSGREVQQSEKNKKKQVRVSKFTDQVIDIGNKHLPVTKKNRYRQQSEEQDYKQSSQNYQSQSQSIKPVTRSKRRVENINHNATKVARNQNSRVTRSRNRN